MNHSLKLVKNVVICAHFLLAILFFTAVGAKSQVNGGVDLTIQPNGQILVYGSNLTVNGAPRSIARLNRDGVPDSSFSYYNPAFSIRSAVAQSDGKIIVAGSTSNEFGSGGLLRRLNVNGTVDSTFTEFSSSANPSAQGTAVTVWAAQADDKIIISTYTSNFGQSVYDVRRLSVNGGSDSTFTTISVSFGGVQVIAPLTTVALQADEKILVLNQPPLNRSSLVRRYLQNGAADSTFTSPEAATGNFGGLINAVAAGADGGIVIGGNFQTVNSVARNNIAKLQTTGSLDTNFISPLGTGNSADEVRRIAITSNNQVIVSTTNRFLKLNANGTVDTTFNSPSAITQITAWRSDSAGRIIFIGTVVENGSPVTRLRRLNTDGSIDNSFTARHSPFDFDGDGKSDVSVFRPSNGYWYTSTNPATNYGGVLFGQSGDKLVPADYDGDGKTDVAVVRNGNWYLQRSQTGFAGIQFGLADDIPVPADYNGDGKAEIAVFRPSNGYWYILNLANNQFTATLFGIASDKPVPADYDGDGKVNIAVNRSGIWYVLRASGETTGFQFGASTDKLVPADYNGDGKTDYAVFRPSNGYWYIYLIGEPVAPAISIVFGMDGDIPVPADYDGDGISDAAVVRGGNWYLNRTTQGFAGVQFGTSTDLPVPNAFVR